MEGSNIIARVPSGASSGDISISYNEKVVIVGAVDINQETDKLYAGIGDDDIGGPSFYELNTDNGTIGDLYFKAAGYDGVSRVLFSKESNTVFNSYCVQCGMVGCFCGYVAQNLDNGLDWSRTVCTDFICPPAGYLVKSMAKEKLFYVYYDQASNFLASLDLLTFQSTLLRDFNVHGEINIPFGSLYIEDTNQLVGFDNASQNFIWVNLDDFTTSEFSYPDVLLSSLQQSQSGRIFATFNNITIVELNPTNGEIIEEIYTHIANINSLSYSESTGRFFWYGNNGDSSRLYIFNPSNQITTVIQFQEKFTQVVSDY